jgi:hypothetical protein
LLTGARSRDRHVALGILLGLLRSIDPDVPVTGFIDTLRLLTGRPL